ncbi:hypothetical protein CTEN210_16683 [Chaetoceros tenuissimus]|uniref:SHSP domain-containing protein n=1 Tax=Chaetoceros tenuissimus TaxID=426638 RepID=A0AAD3D944_9STRA|nr:hypothetical protein CTEN210_16683 [Chaetoceros tenuissimus]
MLSTTLTTTVPAVLRAQLSSPAVYPAMGYMCRDYARRFSTALSTKGINSNPSTTQSPVASFFHDMDDFFQKPFFSPSPNLMPMLKEMSWIDDTRKKNYLTTKFDVESDDKHHIISLDLPGVGMDDVKVEVKDDKLLHIFGGRKMERDGATSELKFDRKWMLDETIDTKNILANMKDGVLRVTLPKIPEAELPAENIRQIKIE